LSSGKPNVSPKANFTYKPELPIVKETITFNDLSIDLDGYIVNWTWNFGDGNISYKQNTSIHTRKREYITLL
jgi:PKD repeat protein